MHGSQQVSCVQPSSLHRPYQSGPPSIEGCIPVLVLSVLSKSGVTYRLSGKYIGHYQNLSVVQSYFIGMSVCQIT